MSAATPAYRYPPSACPVEVHAIPEGVTAVQAATTSEADTLAKQGQIAIVFPRSP